MAANAIAINPLVLPIDPPFTILGRMTGLSPGYQQFFAELKRRRVFRVMVVYGIVGFVLLQI